MTHSDRIVPVKEGYYWALWNERNPRIVELSNEFGDGLVMLFFGSDAFDPYWQVAPWTFLHQEPLTPPGE